MAVAERFTPRQKFSPDSTRSWYWYSTARDLFLERARANGSAAPPARPPVDEREGALSLFARELSTYQLPASGSRFAKCRIRTRPLLRAQRERRRVGRRQRERFVVAVGMRDCVPPSGGKRLDGNAHHVVDGCCAVSVTPPVWVESEACSSRRSRPSARA